MVKETKKETPAGTEVSGVRVGLTGYRIDKSANEPNKLTLVFVLSGIADNLSTVECEAFIRDVQSFLEEKNLT